ncbi:hypothetical protein NLJ89_g7270 [Agrocybe chaxingu]|uniref:Uncharacterized protein n=1 Tax=Agrocybe chaxingu TaxID=84603 RepID=A0A9W8K3Y1_9AGAR|nr:hypothetical protein NLJ89_g7270 [Agrocybe chaxingu]
MQPLSLFEYPFYTSCAKQSQISMVNPGAFKGSRREFLISTKPLYSAGVEGGYAADALALIQYDAAANEEYPVPNEEVLGKDEYAAAMKTYVEHQKVLRFRKVQIKRWFAYQYMKDHDIDPNDSGLNNPYRILLHKLTGTGVKRPQLKTPANIWRRTHWTELEEALKQRVIAVPIAPKQIPALREKVAKDLFSALSEEEKSQWVQQAKEEHDATVKKWERDLKSPPSTAPADRQKCIQGVIRFMQPILNLVSEATGMKTSFLAGSPEPTHDGRLNIISVHSGTTKGDVKMNFGHTERARYKEYIVPIFGSFLQQCYSPEECHACALPKEEGFEPLETMDLDADGATVDSVTLQGSSGPSVSEKGLSPASPAPPAPFDKPPPCHPPVCSPILPPIFLTPLPPHVAPPIPSALLAAPTAVMPAPAPMLSVEAQPITIAPPATSIPHPAALPAAVPAAQNRDAPAEEEEMAPANTPQRSKRNQDATADNEGEAAPGCKRLKRPTSKVIASRRASKHPAQAPANAPKYFNQSHTLFQSEDLEEKWAEIICLWYAFEVQEQFTHVCNLDVKTYEVQFVEWWTSLQPDWRLSDEDKLEKECEGDDWECLRLPGLNGIVSVVAALFFWALALKKG